MNASKVHHETTPNEHPDVVIAREAKLFAAKIKEGEGNVRREKEIVHHATPTCSFISLPSILQWKEFVARESQRPLRMSSV